MDKFVKILRIILLLFFFIWIMSWSSIRAYKSVKAGNSGEVFNTFLVELYKTPYAIRKWFRDTEKLPFLALKVNKSDSLREIGNASDLNISDSIFLLHTTFVDNSTSEVLLQNIKSGEIAKKWTIPLDEIMADSDSTRLMLDQSHLTRNTPKGLNSEIPQNPNEIIIRHALMQDDGSLIFKVAYPGYTYKIDQNSKILWRSKRLAHHSIELDENGNIWTCIVDLNNDKANNIGYKEDAILCLDQEGNELYYKSLTDIFIENNLFDKLIESTPVGYNWNNTFKDPYHLNDVQPVKQDGEFWKKGDLFLSIRNKSLIILYRPQTGKIIMQRQGPWLNQHDIDIENDSIISIFNNNLSFLNDEVKNGNNIALFNFKTSQTNFILNNMSNTKWQGRKSILSSKDIFVEGTHTGIYYLYDSIRTLRYKFYVPYRPEPKYAQFPGWSRLYMKKGGRFLEE